MSEAVLTAGPLAGPPVSPLASPPARALFPPAVSGSLQLHTAGLAGLAAAPEAWGVVLAGLALNHAVLAVAGLSPRSRFLGPNIARLPVGRQTAYLGLQPANREFHAACNRL